MKFELNTTRIDIYKLNLSLSEPLDVLRILNIGVNNNWNIKVEFDEKNRNIVRILSNPPLEKNKIIRALDGRIPALYGSSGIRVKLKNDCYSNYSITDDTKNNNREVYFEFNLEGKVMDEDISIIDHPSIPLLQKQHELKQWIHDNTWFGSLKFLDKNFSCNFSIFGQNIIIYTRKSSDIETRIPIFFERFNLYDKEKFIGEIFVKIQATGSNRIIRHSQYGIFNIDHINKLFWNNFSKDFNGSIEIEIDVPAIEWYTNFGPFDKNVIFKISTNILNKKESIFESDNYYRYLKDVEYYNKSKAAAAITRRQDNIEKTPKVHIDGKVFMVKPSCENELVGLYMKMEASKKLPFDCSVLEYTSKSGIDALANFRLAEIGYYEKYAPIEFEFKLENYFDHGHPLEQTALIICWEKSDEFTQETGYNIEQISDWLYFVHTPGKKIPVVILKNYKKIKII